MNAMNTMKKALSLMLVFVLFATLMPMPARAAEDDITETPCDHAYTAVVTAPTCTTNGYTTYTCSLCGNTYDSSIVSATGHTYTSEEVDGYTVYTCGCGHTYSEKLPTLSYNKVSKFAAGKSYVITVYYSRKFYALTHNGSRVSSREISVENGQVTSPVTDDMLWTYGSNKLSYEENGQTYRLYSGSSVSWAGSGTGTATLVGSTTRSSNVTLSGSRLKVGSYSLRFANGTIGGSTSSGITYVFQETVQ